MRVRGVHSGGKPVERAIAGQRTAVNLAGIEYAELKRGMALAAPGPFHATRRVDVRLTLLPSAKKLKNRARIHFHAGAAETIAEVSLYGLEPVGASGAARAEQNSESAARAVRTAPGLAPGQSALAHLRLQDEMLLIAGDRFIVRQFSPVVTSGGGVVLDPLARRPLAKDAGRRAFLEILEGGQRGEILAAMTDRAALGLARQEVVARTGWLEKEVHETVQELAAAKRVKVVSSEPPLLVSVARFTETRKGIGERVEKFHKENPLSPGMAREDLRASVGRRVQPEIFRAALEELAAEKKLELHGELVKRAGAQITLLPEEAQAKDTIEKAFAEAGLAVPSVKEVLAKLAIDAKRSEKLLQILLRDKVLVRVSMELIFHREALALLREKLSGHKKAKGERITVPAFKDLTGITRKYAIPLLEYLDRERVTRRVGDERVIL